MMKLAIEVLQSEIDVRKSCLRDKEWGNIKDNGDERTPRRVFMNENVQLYKAIRVLKSHKP